MGKSLSVEPIDLVYRIVTSVLVRRIFSHNDIPFILTNFISVDEKRGYIHGIVVHRLAAELACPPERLAEAVRELLGEGAVRTFADGRIALFSGPDGPDKAK